MKIKLPRFITDLINAVFPFLMNFRFIKKVEAIGLIFLIQLLVALLIGSVSIHFFLELAEEVLEENQQLLRIDAYMLDKLNHQYFPEQVSAMKAITYIGSWEFVTMVSVLMILFLYFKTELRVFIVHVLLISFGTMGFNRFLKGIFDRERPDGPHLVSVISSSYPSGHAMLGFAFYSLLIYFAWISGLSLAKKIIITVLLVFLIGLIGLSRVYFGVHYPSDVVAGFAAGAFWLSLSLVTGRAAERIFRKNKARPVMPHDQINS